MKTRLQDLREQFAAGDLPKQEFIRQALDVHRVLFDYADVVRSTDVREITISPEGVSFLIGEEGIRLFAPREEARVAPIEIMNFGCYERTETQVMDLLSDGARQVLDIGANIGWYAVRFAKVLPGAQIHAFEPMPEAHAFLQRNIAANNVGDRVCCYNYAMSDVSGSFEFFIAPTGGTNASLLNVANAPDARKVIAAAFTLDQWCGMRQLKPDFIKCDVEGAELLVFRGGRETLVQFKPVVFAELLRKWSKPFGYHPNDMLGFFRDLGYLCYAVGAGGVRRIEEVNDETVETNYAFVHGSSHVKAIAALEAFR